MAPASKKRNSALELLRIIAMFFIIVSHYSVHGAPSGFIFEFSLNSIFIVFTKLGNLGVIIFVILSGYFLSKSTFKVKRLFQLLAQVLFYSVSIYTILCITGIQQINLRNTFISLFPTTTSLYWFFTAYTVLYLFTPLINKMLDNMSKKSHLTFNITMLVLWSVAPTLTTNSFFGNEIAQFLMFYSIGAYLRKYPDNMLNKKKNNLILVATCALIMMLSVVCILKISEYYPWISKYAAYFYSRSSIFAIGLAVGLVVFFSNLKPFYSKALNIVSGATFGIYLIHDNKFFRTFMWKEIFNTDVHTYSPYVIFHILGSAIVIFAVCCVIELLRQNIIEKPSMKLYDKAESKILSKVNKKA